MEQWHSNTEMVKIIRTLAILRERDERKDATHTNACVNQEQARAVPGARPPRNCPAIFREHEADQHGCKGEGTFSSEIHHKGARDGVRGKAERPGRSFITRKR